VEPRSDHHRHSLIEAALAGQLSDADHEALEEALRTSPEFRREYLEAMQLHLELDLLSRQSEFPANPQHASSRPATTTGDLSRLPWRFVAIMAAAAIVLVAVLFSGGLRTQPADAPDVVNPDLAQVSPPTPPAPVAPPAPVPPAPPRVVDVAGAKIFGEGLSPRPGQEIEFQREYVLTHGLLAIGFETGARAVFRAPSVFSVTDPETVQLRSGQCSVHAPEGAEGFQVISPEAKVVDIGTRFVVDVATTGETELFVVEGAAEVTRSELPPQSAVLLKEGQSARIEPGSMELAPAQSLDGQSFLDALPDRVVRYEASTVADGKAEELLSVFVQREGRIREYPRDLLIPCRLKHFIGPTNFATFCTPQGQELPVGIERLRMLESDWSLATGILNPHPTDYPDHADEMLPVMALEFVRPIVNGPGPDILIFDLQILTDKPEGDTVRVRPGRAGAETEIFTFNTWDIDLTSPFALDLVPHKTYRALSATTSLEDLIHNEFRHGAQVHVNAKCLVMGIDLSDMGYAPGESLTHLEFVGRQTFDPVAIVGLPELKAQP